MRLTSDIRNKVALDLLRYRFSDSLTELMNDRAEFAGRVYEEVIPLRNMHMLLQLPEGYAAGSDSIDLKFGQEYVSLSFNGYFHVHPLPLRQLVLYRQPIIKPVPFKFLNGCAAVLCATHQLSIEYSRLEQRKTKLIEHCRQAYSVAKSTLERFNTRDQAVRHWPEIGPFLPEQRTKPGGGALVVPVLQLNATFNLPKEEAH